MGAYVYMLRCADGSYYIGSATGSDLNQRISEHQSGIRPGYTQLRRPVELVWSEYFDRITDAIAMERRLKGWSRAKKRALIDGDWKSVSRLSKRRGGEPKT
ncbi:MAG TPA: GIY-YIG nuclease family protein [Pseudolabrys sp.]|nr:GIY-YIG nuclease family protein [Pseudolabrys sp.]